MATGTLLKTLPVLHDARLEKAPMMRPIGDAATGFIFVRCDGKYYNIALSEIRYVEARRNYCRIVTAERIYMVLTRLKDFIEGLPSPPFCQIHRAFVVGLLHVKSFDSKYVYLGEEQLAIGEHFASTLLATAPVFNQPRRSRKA